jgi:3,4-dihydroxy 2-butanone 4-phosphate synthase/GTP cyclohydrolase II
MIKSIETIKFPTRYGFFLNSIYKIKSEKEPFTTFAFAIYTPETLTQDTPLVRIHSSCVFSEVLGSLVCDCRPQLEKTLQLFNKKGGILIYIDQEGRSHGIFNKAKELKLQEAGYNTIEASEKLGLEVDARRYESAAAILKDLNAIKIQLVTNNSEKVEGLVKSGIEVVKRVSIEIPSNEFNYKYLKVKKEEMGHFLKLL